MRLDIKRIEAVAECVYDGELPYNTAVAVPVGTEAIHIKDGSVSAVVREGTGVLNGASAIKAVFKRCRDKQKVFALNRSKQFTVLWGTGGIGFTDKKGERRTAGASGMYRFAVDNGSALLRRFGYPDVITEETVKNEMKGIVTGAVKEAVLAAINKEGYNIGGRMSEIQAKVQQLLEKQFADYGLFLDMVIIEEVTDVYGGDGVGEE